MNVMITNEIKENLVKTAIKNSYARNELKKISESDLSDFLYNELETILGFNINIEMKKKRLKKFKIPSSVLDDYDQKIIEYGGSKYVLAGIRHVGGNPDKPFIYIWPGFELKSYYEIEELKKNVVDHFNKFEPKHINIWLSQQSVLYEEIRKRINPVQRLYVGEIDKIVKSDRPEKNNDVVLEEIEDSEYYKWYKDEYNRFHQKYPALKDWIEVNSFELMEEIRSEGLLYYYKIDGEVVGIIAGEKRKIFKKEAVYIDEIMISEGKRGKGYAVDLMRKFIEQLENRVEYIWSHIDSRNLASIKTALRMGQKPISEEFFINI